ncbi:Uncharacterised protein [uncultured archaeon]|nr:Uncharacterised protein [uncultured archaeon]
MAILGCPELLSDQATVLPPIDGNDWFVGLADKGVSEPLEASYM